MTRLKIWSITFSFVALTACANPPPKPVVTLCQLDVPAGEGVCGQTTGDFPTDPAPPCPANTALPGDAATVKAMFGAHPELKIAKVCRVPIAQLDKATAFSPLSWQYVQTYIHDLEDYAKNHCNK